MNSSIIERLINASLLDRLFIDGEWVLPAGHARTSVVDPSTEEPVAEIALGSAQDVAVAVAAARRAFATWSLSTAERRAALHDRVHRLILERA
jgi:aldehyde dehydrogenase (NAD+)